MEKNADFNLGLGPPSLGVDYHNPRSLHKDDLLQHVKADWGLDPTRRNSILEFLEQPNSIELLGAGLVGNVIAKAVGEYKQMGAPARTLLSLAGFGVGSMIYKTLTDRKYTDYSSETGRISVKL